MLIEIDLTDGTPLYSQIAAGIRRALSSGQLAPGDRLPTGRELAEALDVNLETVQRAYRSAADEGLVVSRVGRGTRVADDVDLDRVTLRRDIEALIETAAAAGITQCQLSEMVAEHTP